MGKLWHSSPFRSERQTYTDFCDSQNSDRVYSPYEVDSVRYPVPHSIYYHNPNELARRDFGLPPSWEDESSEYEENITYRTAGAQTAHYAATDNYAVAPLPTPAAALPPSHRPQVPYRTYTETVNRVPRVHIIDPEATFSNTLRSRVGFVWIADTWAPPYPEREPAYPEPSQWVYFWADDSSTNWSDLPDLQ